MTVQDLSSKYHQAVSELHSHVSMLNAERRRLMDEAERQINQALNEKFAETTLALQTASNTAKLAWEAAAEAEALAGDTAPYPLGTVMIRKQKHIRAGCWEDKIIRGIVEAVTNSTEWPAAPHGRRQRDVHPPIGTFIVRHLKSDGQPGKLYDRHLGGWEPVDPTVQKRVFPEIPLEL